MPIGAIVGYGTVFEDGGASFMARVKGTDGSYITQATTTTITCAVFDRLEASVATPTVTVSTSVFDTLQESGATTGKWNPDVDTTGFNFNHDMPAGTFTTGGRYYVEYKVTPSGGADFVFWIPYEVAAMRVLTS